ncbi:OPT oligopeptide transporter [Mycena venus]|uniref:OPT oligopeptide transporter n=1 Tax=Mycena venus TaxID=2733690 RepID=A0A8H6XL07_9AGAR|nr:OPT oligopeptide transporter [Mycena venus]
MTALAQQEDAGICLPLHCFLGSGIGGIGILNITLDWSNITSTVITYPYSVQVIVFVSFVITYDLDLGPRSVFWESLGKSDIQGGLDSPVPRQHHEYGLFTKNGSSYPFNKILSVVDGQEVFNETIYNEVGLAYAGAQYMWEIFWYASYISAFVWFGLFVEPKLVNIYKARRASRSVHTDRLTKIIQANYKDITLYEWLAMFTIPFIILLVVVIKGGIYMPLFTYLIGLAFGGAATLPMTSIYVLSGLMLKVGLFNELIYGYMIRIIYTFPPRAVIGIQIMAAFVGLPVNYGVMRWILYSKYDYLTGIKADPMGEWTAQNFKSYNTAG